MLRNASSDPDRAVVVVAGDVSADWLLHSEGGRRVRLLAVPAGALRLARLTGLACRALGARPEGRILSSRADDPQVVPEELLRRRMYEVSPVPGAGGQPPVFRVTRALGIWGSQDTALRAAGVEGDDPAAGLVVLHDEGDGFRDAPEAWPAAISRPGRTPLVLLGMGRPLGPVPLLQRLAAGHAERLVVVVSAEDLREEGVEISRRLSWERTARELVWQLAYHPALAAFGALPNVIVRFGVEGALLSEAGAGRSHRLFYDPRTPEDGVLESAAGTMPGVSAAFLAAVAASLARGGLAGLREGVRDGLQSARRFLALGLGGDPDRLAEPGAEVFARGEGDGVRIVDVAVPAGSPERADPDFWCILDDLRGAGIELIARQIVLRGEAGSLRDVPVGEFGDLRTVDRAEIESFRSIQNLMRQYLGHPGKRPLCLAVFGPPGSGKSFGVEQVARSVSGSASAKVEKLEFNLSQFESPRDLVMAFHRVRDEVLRGSVPLVFFDEFDADLDGPLGWLRHFLAPMQDGAFKDGEAMHPVGRAIFVFAGGVYRTFGEFAREGPGDGPAGGPPESGDRFREAKGPDFVSRLRGHVDVLGPNPDPARPADRLYLIRRATVLRSLLRRGWEGLIDPEDPSRLNVDESVVRALIGVPEYKHGVRSMEALLEMSLLEGRAAFEPSALPPPAQLDQHVDAAQFSGLVLQGVRFAAAREGLAQAIHEKYRHDRAAEKAADDPAMRAWSDLPETFKRSNRAQADDILEKLELAGCGFRPITGGKAAPFRFSAEEVELLSQREHERWTRERRAEGYTLGPVRDPERKIHPDLVAWEELPEPIRQYDRDTVLGIPAFLASAGFEVYRL